MIRHSFSLLYRRYGKFAELRRLKVVGINPCVLLLEETICRLDVPTTDQGKGYFRYSAGKFVVMIMYSDGRLVNMSFTPVEQLNCKDHHYERHSPRLMSENGKF